MLWFPLSLLLSIPMCFNGTSIRLDDIISHTFGQIHTGDILLQRVPWHSAWQSTMAPTDDPVSRAPSKNSSGRMSRSLTKPPFLSTERMDDPWPKPLLPLDAWQFCWEKFKTGQYCHHLQHKLEVFLGSQTVLLYCIAIFRGNSNSTRLCLSRHGTAFRHQTSYHWQRRQWNG
jgi:hypothetical protein